MGSRPAAGNLGKPTPARIFGRRRLSELTSGQEEPLATRKLQASERRIMAAADAHAAPLAERKQIRNEAIQSQKIKQYRFQRREYVVIP